MFEPTQKQREAIYKMESFAGISSQREYFSDRTEFQEYWDSLDSLCRRKKKRAHISKDPELLKKIQEKKKLKIQAFYLDEGHLFNYGKKYFDRYLPSFAKLKRKLIEKCNDHEVVAIAFQRLTAGASDEKVARFYASKWFHGGSSIYVIKNKLMQKEFQKETIEFVVEELIGGGQEARLISLEKKVESLVKKNKSKFEIELKLQLRGEDRVWLKNYLEEFVDSERVQNQILALYEKYSKNEKDNKKVIKKIVSKGFAYRLVSEIVDANK